MKKVSNIFNIVIDKARGFIKKYGWKAAVAIFVGYLIRDVILYIILPYFIAKNI